MRWLLLSAVALLLFAADVPAATHTVSFTVTAGKHDCAQEPVCIPLVLPAAVTMINRVEIRDGKNRLVAAGQVTPASLVTEAGGKDRQELHFILPALAANTSSDLKAVIEYGGSTTPAGFAWNAKEELRYGDRPILRYEHPTLDESSPKAREETFKVFHHVYDPTGKRLVTKGPGGLYTHHRGLFYGFMKTSYGKTTVDIWHCPAPSEKRPGEAHQAHRDIRSRSTGAVLGRHRVDIDWNGRGKKTFAKEQRELTVYNVPGGTLIEFASLLTPTDEPVKLDGDPQHAGFHFRAANEVAERWEKARKEKTKQETIFIRPDGVDKPGVERNWSAKNTKHVNLPWLGMSFVLDDRRYTVAYLDKPTNPKEARFSERVYGRFGSYFVATATKEKPLLVNYRIWLQEGQMTMDEIAAKSRAFVEPVAVKLR
jgi:hypothetical protein